MIYDAGSQALCQPADFRGRTTAAEDLLDAGHRLKKLFVFVIDRQLTRNQLCDNPIAQSIFPILQLFPSCDR